MKNGISPTTAPAPGERAARAAERRLERQRRTAAGEVDRILAITLGLIERSAPAIPPVSEIVAAAGISNQTLYRTFGNKDELILAVLERGVLRVVETTRGRMAESEDPREQILVWVRMVLRQVSSVDAAETSRSVLGYLHQAGAVEGASQAEVLAPVSALLVEPVAALGGDRVSADCVSDLVLGAMRRYLWNSTAPTRDEIDAIGAFVLRGLQGH
ncbi:TetR/AcrR family transcriptional regulator [Nocardioides immobilis]|uniref:TetR/AcrR family transcriptional regulator n=1 Tax=Nocardioides immobilis TaxID=2049295 RepID=A0A417Y803_9ACTN|nr:TetR/AcrR family transcriptional regulator [Nocardioides immobilis]RHW28596.1 TetR/AcrR family transcriptional regulator [Nocardioides immobilis]